MAVLGVLRLQKDSVGSGCRYTSSDRQMTRGTIMCWQDAFSSKPPPEREGRSKDSLGIFSVIQAHTDRRQEKCCSYAVGQRWPSMLGRRILLAVDAP